MIFGLSTRDLGSASDADRGSVSSESVFSVCVESPIIRPLLHNSHISQDGKSALIFGSENEHAEIVKYLIDAKASLNLQTKVNCPSNPYFYHVYIMVYSYKNGIVNHDNHLLPVSDDENALALANGRNRDFEVFCRFEGFTRSSNTGRLDIKSVIV